MNLLFKEDTFSDDFKRVLGFVDSDMEWNNLYPDLKSSTTKLIELVGNELYEFAITQQQEESNTETDIELIQMLQYSIGLNAYRLYAPTNDLKHSNNGRAMRSDEYEKSPFEWMINRDNKSLELKYYQSVDDLLKFLIEENINNWKNSFQYKRTQRFVIKSTADFEEYFPIESRLLLLKLTPAFRKIERDEFIPILSKSYFLSIKDDAEDGALDDGDTILFKLMQEATVYYAMMWGLKRYSVQLFPEGVLQNYVTDRNALISKKTPDKMELPLAIQSFKKDYKKAIKTLEIELRKQNPDSNMDQDKLENGFALDDGFVTT